MVKDSEFTTVVVDVGARFGVPRCTGICFSWGKTILVVAHGGECSCRYHT